MGALLQKLYKPKLIKCILFLIFLINLGLVGSCARCFLKDISESQFSVEERAKRQKILYDFAKEKVAVAEKKEVYSPNDYFADLESIRDKEYELKVKLLDLFQLGRLQELLKKSMHMGHFNDDDLVNATKIHNEYLRSGGKAGEEASEELRRYIRQIGLSGILSWMLLVYLKCLPLAFILFLLWIKDGEWHEEKFKFPRPLRFASMLVSYPLVIGYAMFRSLIAVQRDILAEAELRRTKRNLFTFLSDEEVKRIKTFARSTASLSYWKEQLKHQELRPRHCLATALVVTFLFILLPTTGKTTSHIKKVSPTNITIGQLAQHLPRMSIEDEHSSQTDWQKGDDNEVITVLYDFVPMMLAKWFVRLKTVFRLQEVFFKISHIPISAIQFEACFTKTLTE